MTTIICDLRDCIYHGCRGNTQPKRNTCVVHITHLEKKGDGLTCVSYMQMPEELKAHLRNEKNAKVQAGRRQKG